MPEKMLWVKAKTFGQTPDGAFVDQNSEPFQVPEGKLSKIWHEVVNEDGSPVKVDKAGSAAVSKAGSTATAVGKAKAATKKAATKKAADEAKPEDPQGSGDASGGAEPQSSKPVVDNDA